MSNKMTISSVMFLSDCVMEEGMTVFVEDSGKVFRCIQGHSGLTWELESKRQLDFPEPQLQEIEFDVPVQERSSPKLKLRLKKAPRYLH